MRGMIRTPNFGGRCGEDCYRCYRREDCQNSKIEKVPEKPTWKPGHQEIENVTAQS